MRESEVEKYLVKVVESMGGECRKVKWIGRRGAPDRVVMLPLKGPSIYVGDTIWYVGDTIWIELKAPGKKPTKTQLREHARMRKLGQQFYVLDSIGAIDRWAAQHKVLSSS